SPQRYSEIAVRAAEKVDIRCGQRERLTNCQRRYTQKHSAHSPHNHCDRYAKPRGYNATSDHGGPKGPPCFHCSQTGCVSAYAHQRSMDNRKLSRGQSDVQANRGNGIHTSSNKDSFSIRAQKRHLDFSILPSRALLALPTISQPILARVPKI